MKLLGLWVVALLVGQSDPEPVARKHFQHAEDLYTLGRFEEARAEYQAAYAARPLPGFRCPAPG